MLNLRRAADRGHARHGWLDSYHTFSFANYHDPAHMGFRALRVINEDRVQPGQGFGKHFHRDMEILTWVLEGTIAHEDSMGNVQTIGAGEMQRMTAGTGVTHSEFNPSDEQELRFLQIWVLPERDGLEPGYEQKPFDSGERPGELLLLASREGRDGSLKVNQDCELHATTLESGQQVTLELGAGRHGFVHVARGEVRVGEETLEEGAAIAVSDQAELSVQGLASDSEVLLFELA